MTWLVIAAMSFVMTAPVSVRGLGPSRGAHPRRRRRGGLVRREFVEPRRPARDTEGRHRRALSVAARRRRTSAGRLVIATVRVLRVRVENAGQIVRAARTVVAYVQGGQPEGADPLAAYYGRSRAQGRARGAAAGLVGLRGEVSGSALERLLRGRHAVSGRPLLAAAGSAGRVPRPQAARGAGGSSDEWLTLAEAARVAGVGATYLRRLVSRTAQTLAAAAVDDGGHEQTDERPRVGDLGEDLSGDDAGARSKAAGPASSSLAGVRGRDGQWRVRRGELERWCAQREAPATVLGYDLVCATPKSVSLLWAFGDDALRADVAAALDAAVDATIGYLERHAVFGRVRGTSRHALGLAVASYLHDVSRSDEAHLHLHNIIINAVVVPTDSESEAGVEGAGGWEWRAIDGEALLTEVKTAGYVGAAVLRHELSARRAVAWLPARNGVAEIAGFPADLLGAFSTRHGEVAEEFAQLVAAGFEPSGATVAAAQRGSRAPKRVLADAEVQALQRDRLTAAGWTIDGVRRLAPAATKPPAPLPATSDDLDPSAIGELFDELSGEDGLTARATTFTRRDVVQQVAAWAGDRIGADAIERLADRYLTDPRVVLLNDTSRRRRRHEPEALYTVEGLLAAEDTLLALWRQGQVAAGGVPRLLVDSELLDTELAAATTPPDRRRPPPGTATPTSGGPAPGRNPSSPRLADEQAELVRRLLTSGDLVRPAVGPAGTGKTEAMRVLTRIARCAGHAVFATAHGGRQAEELAERIGIPARVVTSWLTLLDHTDDPATIWPPGSVLIVDEATQVPTRDAEQLLRYATRTGTVVLLLGDPAQLGSVSAGGWFAHLVDHTPNLPTLATVHRQAGPEMAPVRAALAALRADTTPATRAALDQLAALGRIHLADDDAALLDRAVADWYTERRHTVHARHAAPSRPAAIPQEPSHLDGYPKPTNGRPDARARRSTSRAKPATGIRAAGHHPSEATPTGADGFREPPAAPSRDRQATGPKPVAAEACGTGRDGGDLGGSAPTRPAMVQMMAQYQRDVDLLNAAARVLLTHDGTLTGPALTVAGREFRAGDEVITLTQAGHTLVPAGRPPSAYIRTGTIGIITAIHTDDITADQAVEVYFPSKGTVRVPWDYLTYRFADGRDGGLAHAYAITAAKAQGATMDTARAVVPDDTTRAGLYVMLSRARTDLQAYLLRRDQLRDHDDDESWLPALEADPADGDALAQLADRLARSRDERLATDHDPHAAAVHELRCRHTLAKLTALRLGAEHPKPSPPGPLTGLPHDERRQSTPVPAKRHHFWRGQAQAEPGIALEPPPAPPASPHKPSREPSRARSEQPEAEPHAEPSPEHAEPETSALPRQVLLRRAELAAEAAVRAAAHAHPSARLTARIGPRPAVGAASAVWADAVAALTIYHARHQPPVSEGDLGPPPACGPEAREHDPWLRDHDRAVRLAAAWAAALPPPARSRFHHPQETVPRDRAVAGLHALLDHGHPPDQIAAELATQGVTDVRTGAAVLAHRVADLCANAHLDPALYDLPTPSTSQQEWNTAFRLLCAAEINYLAARPTSDLVAERRAIDRQLASPQGRANTAADRVQQAEVHLRGQRLATALDHQVDQAVLHARHQPAAYLVGLLGPRPAAQPAATAWDQAAGRVEHYRHHVLGLSYGVPAASDDPDPSHAALGARPTDPTRAAAYDHACRPEPALEPQLPF